MEDRSPVFFSYAREDKDFVLRLAKELRIANVSFWLDQLDIEPGDKWDQAVEQALERCDRLVVVLSQAAVASPNVMDEVSFALDHEKQIVPVLMEECKVPFRLRRLQYIDFTEGYEAAFAKLASSLGSEHTSSTTTLSQQPSVQSASKETSASAGPTKLTATAAVSSLTKGLVGCSAGLVAILAILGWFIFNEPRLDGGTSIDPTGTWRFTDKSGEEIINELVSERYGIVANRQGFGKRFFYRKVGDNLYQDANNQTYEFHSDKIAVWTRPDGTVYNLTRQ